MITFMISINNGIIVSPRVLVKLQPGIEHGTLKAIRAIIVHQTDSSTAAQTLNSYGVGGNGAHLLIDKDGTIYQTALLTKICWHIGKIMAKCYEQHSCVGQEAAFYSKLHKLPFSQTVVPSYKHEVATKQYPARFPTNEEAIGIEIVGKKLGLKDNSPFELVTKEQQQSLDFIIGELLIALKLTRTDIYRHPQVSHKSLMEAASAKF